MTLGAGLVLLAGPTVLSFFSGGYFDPARAWAGLLAWILAALALIAASRLPRSRSAWLAIGGLALLGAWTLASMAWAPVRGNAYHSSQLVLMYTGALFAGTLLLRDRWLLRVLEPALAAGGLIVVLYGLSERLLPGLLHFARSVTAQGRLEQPLTYWNAMGELAAIALVLSARIAGDGERPPGLRALAAAAAAPLGMGLYLTYSRGAVFACLVGLLVLLAAAPRREQLASILLALVMGGLAIAAAAPLHGLSALGGSLGARELQGGIALGVLVVLMLAAGAVQLGLSRRLQGGRLAWVPRHPVAWALGLATVALAAVIAVGGAEGSTRQISTGAGRFVALGSNRYDFWRVAIKAFAAQPLHGVGAGGWQVWWLRYRSFAGFARDAHSLPLQTAAELGLVGLALLLIFLAGVAVSGRSALRVAASRAAGPLAGFVAYVTHSPLDWDWQMPALTLVALLLGAALLALSDVQPPTRTAGSNRTALRSARSAVAREPAAERPSADHAARLSGSRATTRLRMRRAPRRSP
jgi:hypothetical protein